jgi:hypothetical protein
LVNKKRSYTFAETKIIKYTRMIIYLEATISLLLQLGEKSKKEIEELIKSGEIKTIERENEETIRYLKII